MSRDDLPESVKEVVRLTEEMRKLGYTIKMPEKKPSPPIAWSPSGFAL